MVMKFVLGLGRSLYVCARPPHAVMQTVPDWPTKYYNIVQMGKKT